MPKVLKIVLITVVVLLVAIILYIAWVLHTLSTIEIRSDKDYATMYVGEEDCVDADMILDPLKKYEQLLQVDIEMREQLASYMRENNYKLKAGKQKFVRNNPKLKELLQDLEFEKIE